MDRVTFDKLCFHLFHRIEMVIIGTLKQADMNADKIDEIILVGGSSRISSIKELILKIFPKKKLNFGLNPDEAIAYGATLRATQISQQGVTNIILNESHAKWLKNTNMQIGDTVSTGCPRISHR
jgi:endoplasmic reticulum chaperone BiP